MHVLHTQLYIRISKFTIINVLLFSSNFPLYILMVKEQNKQKTPPVE